MAYKYGNREQITFLPDSIEKYVTEEDPVRVYDAFVEALNIQELGIKIDDKAVGNSSYDPVVMLKILVYAYSYGWRSSRKIERALHHNLSFIWLAGGIKPDHKTISNFRKNNKQVLKNTLTQCARLCMKLNLIEGNTLFVDGSKFRANAGKSQSKSAEKWERHSKQIEKRIEELLEECQRLDKNEKESLVKVNKELRSKKALKQKIDRFLAEMDDTGKNAEKGRKINGTDPDSKIMKGHQGSHSSYNNQMSVDQKHGLVVAMQASDASNDLNQLNDQVTQAEQVLEKPVKIVCADAGYSSIKDLKLLVNRKKTVIVPNSKQAQKPQHKHQVFEKEFFRYNKKEDTYTCPAGKELVNTGYNDKRGRYEYRMKKPAICRGCQYFGTCTSSKSGRRMYRGKDEKIKESLAKLYESKKGQQIYEVRKMKVEHPFGHIKRNLGAGAFLLRGLEGVNAEINMLGTCFNIARMITLLGGVQKAVTLLKQG